MDEEETGKGIRAYVDSTQPPFLGCITAEPTDMQTIIGPRASYTRIEVARKACHAGNPADGANAIYGASAAVAEIERMHAELARRPTRCWGPPPGRRADPRRVQAAPSCPRMRGVADRRLLPGESPASVLDILRARVEGLRLADRGLTVDVAMADGDACVPDASRSELAQTVDAALAGGPSRVPAPTTGIPRSAPRIHRRSRPSSRRGREVRPRQPVRPSTVWAQLGVGWRLERRHLHRHRHVDRQTTVGQPQPFDTRAKIVEHGRGTRRQQPAVGNHHAFRGHDGAACTAVDLARRSSGGPAAVGPPSELGVHPFDLGDAAEAP